ncbi:MAG: hypothetical protein K2Q10_04845, partial [Rhodospirillales bacterium]|nr:hypothetical protein [Rhodospirillales bacterium]
MAAQVDWQALSETFLRYLHDNAAVPPSFAETLPLPEMAPLQPGEPLEIRHPLSGESLSLTHRPLDAATVRRLAAEAAEGLDDPFLRFLALWRDLPDLLAREGGCDWQYLPADPRLPDHAVHHRADLATAILAAGARPALLSFALGPVQGFIAAARSVRDLWSGSAILSWLTFEAMKPVLEAVGPAAFVFPALRGQPLMDLWLETRGRTRDETASHRTPCLPNRFLALVPATEAADLGKACRDAARGKWL